MTGEYLKKKWGSNDLECKKQSFQKDVSFSDWICFQTVALDLHYPSGHHGQEGLMSFPLKSRKVYSLSAWESLLCSPMYQSNHQCKTNNSKPHSRFSSRKRSFTSVGKESEKMENIWYHDNAVFVYTMFTEAPDFDYCIWEIHHVHWDNFHLEKVPQRYIVWNWASI